MYKEGNATRLQTLRARAEKALREGELLLDDLALDLDDPKQARRQVLGHQEVLEELRVYQAELELQNQELRFAQISADRQRERYTSLFESLPLAALVIDSFGVIHEANPSAHRFFSLNQGALLNRLSAYRYFTREAGEWLTASLAELTNQTDLPENSANTNLQQDLSLVVQRRKLNVAVSLACLPLSYHLDRRFLITLQDRSEEQQLAEDNTSLQASLAKSLASATQKLDKQHFEATDVSVLLADANYRITHVNPSFCQLGGYHEEDLLGQPLFQPASSLLLAPADNPQAQEEILEALTKDRIWAGELKNRKKTSGCWVEKCIINPYYNPAGGLLGFAVLGFDITELLDLREQTTRVERIEVLGALITGLSHEFNNLIGTLNGLNEVNLAITPQDSPLYSNLQQIELAGQRAEKLVQQLREATHVLEPTLELVDLEEFLSSKQALLQSALSGIPLRMEFLSSGQPLKVKVDSAYLLQTLINLLRNSKDACRSRIQPSCSLKVTLACLPDASDYRCYVEIRLRDNGDGMPPEVQQQLFEPFFTTKPAGKGSGLGMMQVLNFVKAHQGSININSYPGEGTEILLRLPLETLN